jgi:O-antigen/teichoic acid export membrane protein
VTDIRTTSPPDGRPWLGGAKRFIVDVGTLLAGSASAQLIVVLAAPALARIFTPVHFAALALLTSTFQIVSRFSSVKFETAIATGRNRPEMAALAFAATVALLTVTCLCVLGSFLVRPLLAGRIGEEAARIFCIVLPLAVLTDGLIQIAVTWLVRWREFGAVSTNEVIRNGSSVLTQGGLGLAGFLSSGLLVGHALGSSLALLLLSRRRSVRELVQRVRGSSRRRMITVARRFKDFPLYQTPKAMLNAANRNMPVILIAAYYSAAGTGFFFFALRLTALPAQLISQSLGRVLLQRFANHWLKHKQSLVRPLAKCTLIFLLPAVPLVVIMLFFGEELFAVFLGEQWRVSGQMAVWTSLWSAALIVTTPSQMAMIVLRGNRVALILEAVFLPFRLLPFPLLARGGDVMPAIAACAIAASLFNLAMICAAFVTAHRRARAVR